MKVLLLSQHFYPDLVSTGLHMTELACRMKKLESDIEITVFCSDLARQEFSKGNKKKIYKGVNIVRVSNLGKLHGSVFSRIVFSISFLFKTLIYCLFNISKFDKILLTTNPPFLGIVPYLMGLIFKVPYIFICYDIYPQIAVKLEIIDKNSLINKIWSKLNIYIYNRADKIVVIGNDMLKKVSEEMKIKDKSKLELIHNWSDKKSIFYIDKKNNKFLKKYNISNKKILLYSGTMGKTHNIEPILNSAFELKNRKDILFVFIGGGTKKILVEEYIKLNKTDNILLLPYQPYEDLSDTLSSATLSFVCLDSKFTGFSVPSKTYGIMATGTPIIGLIDPNSEIGNTIIKYNCGKIWNSSDNKSLSELLIETIDNEKEIIEMSSNSLKAFIENFDLSISASKYLNLIKS